MNPEIKAIEVAKECCSACAKGLSCGNNILVWDTTKVRRFHVKNWTRIRYDEIPAQERCPDFRHKATPKD